MSSRYNEIRVRPVVRYIVTRFERDEKEAGSTFMGEFDSVWPANHLAKLLADSLQADFVAAPELKIESSRPCPFDTVTAMAPMNEQDAIRWTVREVKDA